jgi:hypothetical protein
MKITKKKHHTYFINWSEGQYRKKDKKKLFFNTDQKNN